MIGCTFIVSYQCDAGFGGGNWLEWRLSERPPYLECFCGKVHVLQYLEVSTADALMLTAPQWSTPKPPQPIAPDKQHKRPSTVDWNEIAKSRPSPVKPKGTLVNSDLPVERADRMVPTDHARASERIWPFIELSPCDRGQRIAVRYGIKRAFRRVHFYENTHLDFRKRGTVNDLGSWAALTTRRRHAAGLIHLLIGLGIAS